MLTSSEFLLSILEMLLLPIPLLFMAKIIVFSFDH